MRSDSSIHTITNIVYILCPSNNPCSGEIYEAEDWQDQSFLQIRRNEDILSQEVEIEIPISSQKRIVYIMIMQCL